MTDKPVKRKKKRGRGRPKLKGGKMPKLTLDVQEKIIAYVRAGAYIETAAIAAGITKQTFYTWLRLANNQKSGDLRNFLDAVNKAVAESELISINGIAKAAASGTWQADAWRLERKYPDRWGRRDSMALEHSGKGGAPLPVAPPQIIINLPANGYTAEENPQNLLEAESSESK